MFSVLLNLNALLASGIRKRHFWETRIDFMPKDEMVAYFKENASAKKDMLNTIRMMFEVDEPFSDEECLKVLSSLLTARKICWRRPARKLSFQQWDVYDLSLRVLCLDSELMKNQKLASVVVQKFTEIKPSQATEEGFSIILEGLAKNVFPFHFDNYWIMRKFLGFAKIRRSDLLSYLRDKTQIDASMLGYFKSPIVRAYYNSFFLHLLVFHALYDRIALELNSMLAVSLLCASLVFLSFLFFNLFLIPFV